MKNENKTMADVRHKIIRKEKAVDPKIQSRAVRPIDLLARKSGHNMDITRSKAISHFSPIAPASTIAKQPKPIAKPVISKPSLDIKPTSHPLARNIPTQPIAKNPASSTAKETKDAAIAEVFQKISDRQKQEREAEKKRSRTILIITSVIAVVGICIYFLLISLPAISIGIANAKSGFEASIPSFSPSGYNRDGLASYSDGQVIINYKSTNGTDSFSFKQAKSSWDSSAVKNMVDEASAGKFNTTEKNGLTIFYYNNDAAWVNGGILYKISGSKPLEISDIAQIALSL